MIDEYLNSRIPEPARKRLEGRLWKLLRNDELVEEAIRIALIHASHLRTGAWTSPRDGEEHRKRFRSALGMLPDDVSEHIFSGALREAMERARGDIELADALLPLVIEERARRPFTRGAQDMRPAMRRLFAARIARVAQAADLPLASHPKAPFVQLLDAALDVARAGAPGAEIQGSGRWLARHYLALFGESGTE